jgi:hypothetical protein
MAGWRRIERAARLVGRGILQQRVVGGRAGEGDRGVGVDAPREGTRHAVPATVDAPDRDDADAVGVLRDAHVVERRRGTLAQDVPVAAELMVEHQQAVVVRAVDREEREAVVADAELLGLVGSVRRPAECRPARLQRVAPRHQHLEFVVGRDRRPGAAAVVDRDRRETDQVTLRCGSGGSKRARREERGSTCQPAAQHLAPREAYAQDRVERAVARGVGWHVVMRLRHGPGPVGG